MLTHINEKGYAKMVDISEKMILKEQLWLQLQLLLVRKL